MSGTVGAHHLLGRANEGKLILLVGPEYGRMQQMAALSGIEARDISRIANLEMLKAGVLLSGRSLAVIASAPEVEGNLDRTAFGSRLTALAYSADKVIYCGTQGGVLVHPQHPSTRMSVRQGKVTVTQTVNVVRTG